MRRQQQHERDVRKADRAVRAIIASVVVGVIALALALLVSPSTVLVVIGAVIAPAILWRLLALQCRAGLPRRDISDRPVASPLDGRRTGVPWPSVSTTGAPAYAGITCSCY